MNILITTVAVIFGVGFVGFWGLMIAHVIFDIGD